MTTTAALSPTLRADVRELLATTTAHDGVSPLDEAAILALEGERAHHILREQDAADGTARLLVGYTNVLADGTVIEGLYSAGNNSASVMGTTYPGPGSTLGPAVVFGMIAAQHMARHMAPARG